MFLGLKENVLKHLKKNGKIKKPTKAKITRIKKVKKRYIYTYSVPCLLHQQNTTVILTAISHDGCVVLANRSQGQYHTNDTSSNCKMCQLPIPNECIYPNIYIYIYVYIYICIYIYSVYDGTMLFIIYIYIYRCCLCSEWIWAALFEFTD